MDTDSTPTRGPISKPGGLVEPQQRSPAQGNKKPEAGLSAARHYEIRDPFAEVTYRLSSFEAMVSKAESLGSSRFVEVTADGTRIQVLKSGGTWARSKERPALATAVHATRSEPVHQAGPDKAADSTQAHSRGGGDVPSPESTTFPKVSKKDQRILFVAQVEAALAERYVIKRSPLPLGPVSIGHTEYRFKGDSARLAFTESNVRLATEVNNPSVARSMVDVAEARNWKGLRVSGHEDFKRMVWLEASIRSIKTVGYDPQTGDLELLQRERLARTGNRIEPAKGSPESSSQSAPPKTSARGSGGRKAILVAIEALLIAKQVPERIREAVIAAASDQLVQRMQAGHSPKVKVYDPAAPSRARVQSTAIQPQRARDQEGLTHAR